MKILMVLMGLEIGGAETHVAELSKELKRRGHDITIASNGGVFVPELEKAGIAHVQLPLHSRMIKNMYRSYRGLKKLIKEGGFDLVHAHARIPAFICSLVRRSVRFRFITTTHWVFKTGLLLNLMTNWGERTIAVSEDIKQYLIDNYKVPAQNITVTINGIDMETFSPQTSAGEVVQEFGMAQGRRRIVYVSRLDADRSAVAKDLINIAPKLQQRFGDIEIVVVGGGNDFANVQSAAQNANRITGERTVILTGARTDISKFVAAGDLFVGVSRSALEAMSAALPVIIAGNEGYIGIFGPDKLQLGIDTNFCCRGCEMPTQERLFQDVCTLLELDKDERDRMGLYNRKIIFELYSAKRMADDCLKAYRGLLSFNPYRPKDVLISGYYGYNNIGDDSLLEAIVSNLRAQKEDVDITVLSRRPNAIQAALKVNALPRFNIFSILGTMRRSKLLISGGGSLIQDGTSTRSLKYYLFIINLAKKCGMKVMMYANGFGPIKNKRNREKVRKCLNKVDCITLREPSSYDEIKQMGLTCPDIGVSADPAFSLQKESTGVARQMLRDEGLDPGQRYFAVSVREWKGNAPDFPQKLAALCRYIYDKYGYTPVFIPMQKRMDSGICNRICAMTGCKGAVLHGNYRASQLMALLDKMEMAIGMRLHFLIYAAAVGTPVLGLSYDPKVDGVLKSIHQEQMADVQNVDLTAIEEAVDYIVGNRDKIKRDLGEVVEQMKEVSMSDARRAVEILHSKSC